MTQTIILYSPQRRAIARDLIDRAPVNAVVTIKEAKRTTDQNAKMWAMLSDVARAKPQGRVHPAETWKALFCHACGWEVQFEMGLNNQPFPTGYRTSRMTKEQMSELIEFIYKFGAENGIEWSEVVE